MKCVKTHDAMFGAHKKELTTHHTFLGTEEVSVVYSNIAGFYGKSNLEGLQIDQVVQLAADFMNTFVPWFRESDEAKKVFICFLL